VSRLRDLELISEDLLTHIYMGKVIHTIRSYYKNKISQNNV